MLLTPWVDNFNYPRLIPPRGRYTCGGQDGGRGLQSPENPLCCQLHGTRILCDSTCAVRDGLRHPQAGASPAPDTV